MLENNQLASRAGGVIAVTVALALAFALLLAFLKFDKKLLDVTAARMSIVADTVREQGQTGLDLGLDLAELQDLEGVLKRAAQVSGVVRIDVQTNVGTVLFSTDPKVIGNKVSLANLKPAPSGRFRQRVDNDQLILAADLADGIGRDAGDVVLYASVAKTRETLVMVRNELLISTAPVIVIALIITLLAVRVTVKRAGKRPTESRSSSETIMVSTDNADQLHHTLEPRLLAAVARAEAELKALKEPGK